MGHQPSHSNLLPRSNRKKKKKERKEKEKERKETKQPEDFISLRKQFQVLGGKFKPGLEPFSFLDKKPIRKQR